MCTSTSNVWWRLGGGFTRARGSSSVTFSLTRLFAVTITIVASLLSLCTTEDSLMVKKQPIYAGHSLGKRVYFNLGCKGNYDMSSFARLDRICEDCYNLFRDPTLHALCRQKCFTSEFFLGCVESLHETDKIENFKEMIKILHGGDPHVK